MPTPQERIAQLSQEIEDHDRRYYVEARPVIGDAEYDALFRELRDLEAAHPDLVLPNSPTQRVGGKATDGFAQVRHAVPMLSLDNLFAKDGLDGLKKWILSVEKLLPGETLEWLIEPKVDGLARSIAPLGKRKARYRSHVRRWRTHNANTQCEHTMGQSRDSPVTVPLSATNLPGRSCPSPTQRQRGLPWFYLTHEIFRPKPKISYDSAWRFACNRIGWRSYGTLQRKR